MVKRVKLKRAWDFQWVLTLTWNLEFQGFTNLSRTFSRDFKTRQVKQKEKYFRLNSMKLTDVENSNGIVSKITFRGWGGLRRVRQMARVDVSLSRQKKFRRLVRPIPWSHLVVVIFCHNHFIELSRRCQFHF